MDEILHNLRLKSDSGHHYYFLPIAASASLTEELLERAQLTSRFPPKPSQPKLTRSLSEFASTYPDWITGPEGFKWIKVKFSEQRMPISRGILGAGQHVVRGIWLCIETNTGAKDKGNFYHREIGDSQEVIESIKAEHSQYVCTDPLKLDRTMRVDLSSVFTQLKDFVGSTNIPRLVLNILWNEYDESDIPVRLLVDYGNSRTVAAAIDNAPHASGDSQLSYISRLIDLNSEYQAADNFFIEENQKVYDDYISDSWMVLRTPIFEGSQDPITSGCSRELIMEWSNLSFWDKLFRRKSKLVSSEINYYKPYMFRELSPAAIGKPAYEVVGNAEIDVFINYFLSAPKRYCWDHDPVGSGGSSYWYMIDTAESTGLTKTKELSGEALRYLPYDFEDRFLGLPNGHDEDPSMGQSGNPVDREPEHQQMSKPRKAEYPKADAMIWSALRIIEIANRQVQSEAYRAGRPPGKRKITEVVLSYPSGWTHSEKQSFLDAWRSAANIFYWSRFGEEETPVNVRLGLDEAVASQLPIVFADITHLGNNVQRWLELYGKKRQEGLSCRVLTIDIGGGTVDTSVVEYFDGSEDDSPTTPNLAPKVLLTDSSYHAGDKLIKDLTEKLLIPELCKGLEEDSIKILYKYLKGGDTMAVDTSKRAVMNRTVFLPMILGWLKKMSLYMDSSRTGGVISLSATEAGCHYAKLSELNLDLSKLGISVDVWKHDNPMVVNVSDIRSVVVEWLNPLVNSSVKYLGGMDCDLVVVTGKPSEIETVRHELLERLPIDSTKVIFAKGFYGGKHLPLSSDGAEDKYIPDAKLVTLTGSIIREATDVDNAKLAVEGSGSLVKNWQIASTVYDSEFSKNYWHLETFDGSIDKDRCLLEPDQDDFILKHSAKSSAHLSRSKFRNGEKELVYELRQVAYNDEAKFDVVKPINFKIKRIMDKQTEQDQVLITEKLVLEGVSGKYRDGTEAILSHWELRVKTMYGDHWLDDPKFDRVTTNTVST
ncbi:virulence factor SrfB [Leucothrix mucor]|uniref:virulence factor SrfB n=1 Tax=Leucothrix mucor TaxID=45248 RepID=UPI0003B3A769|nr:virulence factor SrfB [Leucothrix mucor]